MIDTLEILQHKHAMQVLERILLNGPGFICEFTENSKTVFYRIHELIDCGLIEKTDDNLIALTNSGLWIALKIHEIHELKIGGRQDAL